MRASSQLNPSFAVVVGFEAQWNWVRSRHQCNFRMRYHSSEGIGHADCHISGCPLLRWKHARGKSRSEK